MGQPQAINSPRTDEIKLETNIPQTFALKYSTGKPVGQWGNIMFTAIDSRRLFLNTEDASEFEHALVDLRIQPAEFIRCTRVKHGTGRGGGFSLRVERVPDKAETSPAERRFVDSVEAQLEKSLEMVRAGSPEPAPRAPETEKTVGLQTDSTNNYLHQSNGTPPPVVITPASAAMCAAMRSAVDAILETQAYATKRGLGLTFSEESVRAIGLSIYIGAQREGR